jgi:hypothetical protein
MTTSPRRTVSYLAAVAATVVGAAAVTVAPLAAQPVTISFAEYVSPTVAEYAATPGDPLTVGGFDFYEFLSGGARNVLGTWGTSDVTAVNRPSNIGSSVALFSTQAANEIDMYVAGDNVVTPTRTFNMYAIDVAHLFSAPAYNTVLQTFTLTFSGAYLAGGPNVTQTFTVNAPPTVGGVTTPLLQTLQFDNRWRGLANVWWNQNNQFLSQQHQFTNVRAEVTPEPATYALVAGGLGALLVVARRRRA